MFELTDKGNLSYNMAVWADDNIQGYFAYRDWTGDGLPTVRKGDTYWSGFTFQRLSDAKEFVKEYGGSGNWMEGHTEFVKQCNKKRRI